MILHFSWVHDARGTWHEPMREGLHKLLANPVGQTGGGRPQICRPHVYSPNVCAFVVGVLVGCRLHAPGTEKFFD